jgi:hypothetical protein
MKKAIIKPKVTQEKELVREMYREIPKLLEREKELLKELAKH